MDRDLARKTIFMSDKLNQLLALKIRLTAIDAQADLLIELADFLTNFSGFITVDLMKDWMIDKLKSGIEERQSVQAQLVAYDAQNPTE